MAFYKGMVKGMVKKLKSKVAAKKGATKKGSRISLGDYRNIGRKKPGKMSRVASKVTKKQAPTKSVKAPKKGYSVAKKGMGIKAGKSQSRGRRGVFKSGVIRK